MFLSTHSSRYNSMRLFFKKQYFLLFFIFFLAFFVRVFMLGSLPRHLHQDEIMNGYVGRFTLENGKDLYNNSWPVFYFDNFGDYPNIIPMYFSGVFTYLLGKSEFAIRFPIALMGALSVFPVYLLIRKLTNSIEASLASAVFMAFSPWNIVLSRSTAEAVTGSTVILTGFFLLTQAADGINQRRNYLISTALFVLSYFLYQPFRLILEKPFLTFRCFLSLWSFCTGSLQA